MSETEKKKVQELHESECKEKEKLKKEVAENMETDIKKKGRELARYWLELVIINSSLSNRHLERRQLYTTYCKQPCFDFMHSWVESSQS